MKMPRLPLCRLLLTLVAVALAGGSQAAPAANDESDLPATLRRGYVGPILGPAADAAYARGALGLIRPTFGRASLFVAWRVMHLPVGAVAKESHARVGDWLHAGPTPATPAQDEIEAWLKARGALVPRPPAAAPEYYRTSKVKVEGFGEIDSETGQCGPDAYAFATRTLAELVSDTSLKDADRRTWIAGQDAVFARCAWVPGKKPVPALPAPLPSGAAAKLKALQAYQHAAALFYSDDFKAARAAFDSIAAVPDHPMRAWATLGALRSVVREAVRDVEWDAAVADAWTKRQLRGAAFQAAVAEPAARHNARVDAALKEIEARGNPVMADSSLAPVHGAYMYTARRALMQLSPRVPLEQAMKALDDPARNPYTTSLLDLFQSLYPMVSPERPEGIIGAALRAHAWFDFVATVQGCSDAPETSDDAVCAGEHARAQGRWQATNDNAWLLATLMTARKPSAADVPAAEAARAVAADRPEWASLQFYAARVLRAQGRGTEARAALDALAASLVVHKRDRLLVEAERRAL